MRGTSALSFLVPVLVIGILLLVGAMGGLSPPAQSLRPSSAPGGSAHPSPSEQLASARTSAAHGGGPWGKVVPPRAAPGALTEPNLTFGVVMTYDAADGYVLAVSLNASAGPYNNTYGPTQLTWKFSGGNWSLISTVGQVPATLSPGLVFDARDNYVLLYGGRLMATSALVAPVTNQTWSYRAGVWTNLSGSSTPAPWSVTFVNLVYDAADEYVLLYNEIGITPTNPNGYLNTTWTYAAGVWTNITGTAGTPPQMFGAMAYDALDQYVLYFGGYTWWNQLTNATWTFHGGVWSNISSNVSGAPPARIDFGIAYDSLHAYVILYGGVVQLGGYNTSAFSYETWAYTGGAWTLLSANGTIWSIQSMTYDPADNESVLLGANSSFALPPNVVTWVYSAGVWAVAAPAFGRALWVTDVGHPLTLTIRQPVNEGGLAYQYSNLPPGCSSSNVASLLCTPSSSGTYVVTVTMTGAAGFSARVATTVQVNSDPAILGFSGTPPFGEVGLASQINVSAGSGTGPLVYAYVGLPPGCASGNTPALRCTPTVAGSFNVTVEITDALGVTAESSVAFQVSASLSVAALSLDRTALDVGQPISVSTALTGGVGPYRYSYSGLPAGCASVDANRLICRPAATGSFSIRAAVTDELGALAPGTAGLVVNALPSVVAFVPSNATIASDGSVSLATSISGGTAPFQYRYSGLPDGCSQTVPAVVTCSSLASGDYSVVVTVQDSTGATATGNTTFVVLTAPVKPISVGPSGGLVSGFWGGFAIAAVAIGVAALIGVYRLRMVRKGQELFQDLQVAGKEPTGTSSPVSTDYSDTELETEG
ncbi:MAG: hypothetical protein ACHQ2Y_07325 [Candidatus Lutacidiplasmatales archaeon]